jgi:hypothetical protein
MGPARGASDGPVRGETCDLGPPRSRASSRGPRPVARSPIGCAASSRRGRCPAIGTRPPAPEGDDLAGPYRAGRGALTPDAGDGPGVAADRLDPGGDLARRGPPPSGLRQVGDIRVPRGSAAAPWMGDGRPLVSASKAGTSTIRRVTRSIPRYVRRRVSGTQPARRQRETSRERAHRGRPRTGDDHRSEGTGPTAHDSMEHPSPSSGPGVSSDLTLRVPTRCPRGRCAGCRRVRRTPPA